MPSARARFAPTDIVVDTGRAGGADDPGVQSATQRLISGLEADPEVAQVEFGDSPQYIDASGRYLHLSVAGRHDYGMPEAQDYVHRLRDQIIPTAGFPESTEVLAGGGPPGGVDFLDLRTPTSRGSCWQCSCSRTSCWCVRSGRCSCR